MAAITTIAQLEDRLSTPNTGVIESLSKMKGDLLILGVAGKIGPNLARMARRAFAAAGTKNRVIGVARQKALKTSKEAASLKSAGVETVACDLMDPQQFAKVPDAANVLFLAGMKFGSTGNEALTWAMNVFLPGLVAQRYRQSRIVAYSTGNIYGLRPVASGGSVETDPPNPAGDYAMSCLGRERIFEHFSNVYKTPMTIFRLNYSCELRYGVLVDLAQKIRAGQDIDLAMAHFNVVWQQDANAMALRSLEVAASPATYLNVTGPEILSVRQVCGELGKIIGKEPRFTGMESSDALLSNAHKAFAAFGYPETPASQLIEWVGQWTKRGRATLNKPTHFETRSGKY